MNCICSVSSCVVLQAEPLELSSILVCCHGRNCTVISHIVHCIARRWLCLSILLLHDIAGAIYSLSMYIPMFKSLYTMNCSTSRLCRLLSIKQHLMCAEVLKLNLL